MAAALEERRSQVVFCFSSGPFYEQYDLRGLNIQIYLSASQIHKQVDKIILRSTETYDLIASIPIDKVTFSSAISPLASLEADLFPLVQSCIFLRMVSTCDDIRQASADAERMLDSHFLTCRKREDVYRVISAYRDRREEVAPEVQRFIDCLIKDFERNGVALNSDKRKEFDNLRSKIDDLSLLFIKNLTLDDSFLQFGESELRGLPPQFIKSLDVVENGKLKITLRSHHISPILEHCKVGSTRKCVAVAHGTRCGKANTAILEKLVRLRKKMAQLLGYSCFADYIVEPRMARTSTRVLEFLEDISCHLTEMAMRELNVLKDLKKNEEGDFPFGAEDLRYYMKRAEEKMIDAELQTAKFLFPVDMVLSGVLKTFQELLHLEFEEVLDVDTWHDAVRLFAVMDPSSNELMGYFFLDMFSREGKYSQTCVVAVQDGSMSSGGINQTPVALLISQFPKQEDDSPVLLQFSEVLNFFHEFGHVLQHICNRATFSRFSGLRMEVDFLEIPSQMLEKWCYESICMKQISGYDQDTVKPSKEEWCCSLRRRRDLFLGLKVKEEVLFCIVDQIIHSSEEIDIEKLLKHLHPKVLLGIPLLEGTNPAACFPRFAIGYEATCYSHLWSEVVAADIYASKFQEDIMNQRAGLQFRNKVLSPGGSRDPMLIIQEYLGREPSIQAFIMSKTMSSPWQ
ncbi:zincin-like metalloproteases family protein isoform X2 [Wolffia australiana]